MPEDPRKLPASTDYRGMSEATFGQKLALNHPSVYEGLKAIMSDIGIGPVAMIPTEANLPRFMAEWAKNTGATQEARAGAKGLLGRIAEMFKNPSEADQMIGWWRTRHPNLTRDMSIAESGSLPSSTTGRYLDPMQMGKPATTMPSGLVQVNKKVPVGDFLDPYGNLSPVESRSSVGESLAKTLGHETTHAIQASRDTDALQQYLDWLRGKADITYKTPELYQQYWEQPLEQQARQGGVTAGKEWQKFQDLIKVQLGKK